MRSATDNKKIGRNDPCYCGSGKKYKKCCLLNAVSTPPEDKLSPISQTVITKSQARLSERVRNIFGHKTDIIDALPIKMSQVILHIAEDLLRIAHTPKRERAAIAATCIGWNIAVACKSEQELETVLDKTCRKLAKSKQDEEDARTTFMLIINRKKLYYRDLDRIIIDYELEQHDRGLHLNVISTPSTKESEHLSKQLLEKSNGSSINNVCNL